MTENTGTEASEALGTAKAGGLQSIENAGMQSGSSVTGFDGMSTLVSDVSPALLSDAAKPRSAQQNGASAKPETKVLQSPAPSANKGSGYWWLGIIALVAIAVLGSGPGKRNGDIQGDSSDAQSSVIDNGDSQASSTTYPSEELPPIGQNSVLSIAQIEYCLAEKIRIGASEQLVDVTNDALVDRFNSYVDDYNKRCSSFRYRGAALDVARKQIEPYRRQYESEGRARF